MATWQTPRTTWSGEDGVTSSDFNRIEGNLQYLFDTKADQATDVVSYYVSNSGSDANDGLTSSTAFATIQKALDMIPKSLGGASVVIRVASGLYAGFTLADFSGGIITLDFGTADVIVNTNTLISNCHAVQISGSGSFQVRAQWRIINTTCFMCSPDVTITRTSTNALEVIQSRAIFPSSLTISGGTSYRALLADNASLVFVESLLIMSGTGTGIMSDRGSTVAYSSSNNNASVNIGSARGGRVYTGSQGLNPGGLS